MRTIIIAFKILVFLSLPISADIIIKDAFAIKTTPTSNTGAIFMEIHNNGASDDQLLSIKTDVAKMAQLHTHEMDGDVMKMIHVIEGFTVTAKSVLYLERGGNHVMLMGISKPIVMNELFELTLQFKNIGDIKILVPYHGSNKKTYTMEHNDH